MNDLSIHKDALRRRLPTHSSEVRAKLDHPIIDSDGHILEFEAAVMDNLEKLAGRKARERFGRDARVGNMHGNYARMWGSELHSLKERLDQRMPKLAWWALPTTATLDRAAASLPALMKARLDETGIDFSILYPTFGLVTLHFDDDELRPAACRAVNTYNMDVIGPEGDRLCAVACIPMHTPQEAIIELEYAVKVQGFKAVVMPSYVTRPVPSVAREHPQLAKISHWMDTYAVDSLYDYDPVWAKCVELGVNPTFHTPGYGFGTRTSVTNFVHNHMGAFAAAGEGVARALVMGGVPHRFPALRFGMLEGGVGWGCMLYSHLMDHFAKRNMKFCDEQLNPKRLDMQLYHSMHKLYGAPVVQDRLNRVGKSEMALNALDAEGHTAASESVVCDEFEASGIRSKEDIKRLFAERFYFGCEADDPINVWAFNDKVNPLGTKLNAILSSDIGHFDVADITEIAEEAFEAVEHGLMTPQDFRAFTFENPVEFWTSGNRDFFKGTVVETAVDGVLKGKKTV